MAYTCVIEKQKVTKLVKDIYRIEALVTVSDGSTTVLQETITALYNKRVVSFDLVEAALLKKMQNIWDKFKAENDIFTSSTLDSAIVDLQTKCNTYINS